MSASLNLSSIFLAKGTTDKKGLAIDPHRAGGRITFLTD